jgi:hypothetical protein
MKPPGPEAPVVIVKWYDYAKWLLERVETSLVSRAGCKIRSNKPKHRRRLVAQAKAVSGACFAEGTAAELDGD